MKQASQSTFIMPQQSLFSNILSSEEFSRYEIARLATLNPEDIALPTDSPPLWLPNKLMVG